MPKPICVRCQRFFKPKKNGVHVLEQMPAVYGARPGAEHAEDWKPYKVWMADKLACEGCGAEIIVGYGYHSLAEHYQPSFEAERALATYTVNDC
jgi:hypothetical protein